MSDTSRGMYVGTDGMRTNGASGQYTTITGGVVDSNQTVSAYGFSAKSANAGISSTGGGTVYGAKYQTVSGGSTYDGATGDITWVASGHGYGLSVKNGIVTAVISN